MARSSAALYLKSESRSSTACTLFSSSQRAWAAAESPMVLQLGVAKRARTRSTGGAKRSVIRSSEPSSEKCDAGSDLALRRPPTRSHCDILLLRNALLLVLHNSHFVSTGVCVPQGPSPHRPLVQGRFFCHCWRHSKRTHRAPHPAGHCSAARVRGRRGPGGMVPEDPQSWALQCRLDKGRARAGGREAWCQRTH